jgi:hypothetical protein
MERGIEHLAVYNVGYYVSYTEAGAEAARAAGLAEVGTAPPWRIFALPPSSLVDVATSIPAVWAGGGDFLDPALEWYDDVANMDKWLVADGPADWNRVETVDERLATVEEVFGSGVVTNVVSDDHRISFTTSAVGIPHLVKVSYFPNWRAQGAEGPYRAAPSLMVVVPTSEEVVLEFRNTYAENIGMALTLIAIVGLGVYAYRRHRNRTVVNAA